MAHMFRRYLAKQLAHPSGWFGRLFTARWLEKANVAMNALALECLELDAGDRLLEVGFGSGYLLEKALDEESCAFAAGLDASGEMVRLGKRRFGRQIASGRAVVLEGMAEHLPFEDGEFTKVCSVNTLYFWGDPLAALAECRRVLKAGGALVLCFNAKADLARWLGDTRGFTLYELSEVETLLSRAGFDRLETVPERDPEQGLFYCVRGMAPAH